MDYEVIVLGATFTAAGIMQVYGDDCLILERRPQAGYEFFNAIKFGNDYEQCLCSDEANSLFKVFDEKNAFEGERVCLFDCASSFYSLLEGKNVMLNMEIVSVRKTTDGFEVEAYGVSGYRIFRARKVIDTRVQKDMIASKTFNFLINSETDEAFPVPEGVKTEKWGYERDIVLKCHVAVNASYADARKAVVNILAKLPEKYKMALAADMFDYELKADCRTEKNGIAFLPSCAYKNPLLAFDAGVLYAKGGEL